MPNNFDLQIKWLNGSQVEIQAGEGAALTGDEKVLVMQNDTPKETTAQAIADLGSGGGSSYLVYTALLTQSGTSAPVSTILQNTLGVTPVWSYEAVGQYDLIAPLGTYTENKTWVIISEIFTNDIVGKTLAVWVDTERVEVSTSDDAGLPIDGSLSGNSIEIRVYP